MRSKSEDVLILGASTNPSRYAYIAARMLTEKGHTIFPVGIKKGDLFGKEITPNFPEKQPVDTITLYINPNLQTQYISDIIALNPNRVIFNPGTESELNIALLTAEGISCVEACTLVMLRTNQF